MAIAAIRLAFGQQPGPDLEPFARLAPLYLARALPLQGIRPHPPLPSPASKVTPPADHLPNHTTSRTLPAPWALASADMTAQTRSQSPPGVIASLRVSTSDR